MSIVTTREKNSRRVCSSTSLSRISQVLFGLFLSLLFEIKIKTNLLTSEKLFIMLVSRHNITKLQNVKIICISKIIA